MSNIRFYIGITAILIASFLSISLITLQSESLSLIWDEDSYIASAVHIADNYSLDTNFEVPPLSKIYMSLWIPPKFKKYVIPMEDNIRASHGNFPLAFFDKLTLGEKKELLQSVRKGQIYLFFISLFTLIGYTFISLQPHKNDSWLTFALVSCTLLLSPQLFSWSTIAFTDGMVVFVLTLIFCFASVHLQKIHSYSIQRQLGVHFLIGILVGLGILTKGSFIGFGAVLIFAWAIAIYLAKKKFVVPFFVSVAGTLLCLHAWTLPDNFLWIFPNANRLSYTDWSHFFVKSWGQEDNIIMKLSLILSNWHVLPKLIPNIIAFNLNIINSHYTSDLLGQQVDQNLYYSLIYILLKSSPADLLLLLGTLTLPLYLLRKRILLPEHAFLIICLTGYGFFFLISKIKISFHYYIPVMVMGYFSIVLFLRESKEKYNFYLSKLFVLLALLAVQLFILHKNSPNFLSQYNPLIYLAGGPLNNLSVLDDNGQENWSIREELQNYKPSLWLHNSAPEWNLSPSPMPTVTCSDRDNFTFATGARMIKSKELYLVRPLVGDINKPFRQTGHLGLFFNTTCAQHNQLLQFLNSDFPLNNTKLNISNILNPVSLVLACREKMSDFVIYEGQEIPLQKSFYYTRFSYQSKHGPTIVYFVRISENTRSFQFKDMNGHCEGRFY